MNPARRSCPDCGARLPFLMQWVFAGPGHQWNCGSCSRRLQYSWRRALLIWVLRMPIVALQAYGLVRHEWGLAVGAFVVGLGFGWFEKVEVVGQSELGKGGCENGNQLS